MLVANETRRVAIVGGIRTPFARANSAYSALNNQELLTAALRGLVERFGLQGERLGDVAAGAVIKYPRDYNLTRESLLSTGLDPQTPGLDLQRACGTGLEAAVLVANKIALGQIDAVSPVAWMSPATPPSSTPNPFSACCCAAPMAARSPVA